MSHKNKVLSSHYPCEKCELETLREQIAHNGLGWTINNLVDLLKIDALKEFKTKLDRLIELENKDQDLTLQSNDEDLK